ncbi:hypothetical protein [Tahibacter amnicola]|uniref:Uncharacterized protein n=1 Tax=Tahibacter amnicola TaxID=2976241 RepID=A0ABY6BDV2_9GAMM|nr:hypothetical protein [Tahibacter amnicola]UXI67771.1 hypothetical protein N4264_24060 [Tahibacter amnicola]
MKTSSRNTERSHLPEAPEYSIQDVLVSPLAVDHADFPRLLGAARYERDSALASLRTLAQVIRTISSRDEPPDGDMVHDVGKLVAHFANYADAMTTLESHADYQWQRLGHEDTSQVEA